MVDIDNELKELWLKDLRLQESAQIVEALDEINKAEPSTKSLLAAIALAGKRSKSRFWIPIGFPVFPILAPSMVALVLIALIASGRAAKQTELSLDEQIVLSGVIDEQFDLDDLDFDDDLLELSEVL